MKKIFIQIFCPTWPSCQLWYAILWLIRSELYNFGIRTQKIVFYIAVIGREQTIDSSITQALKKLTKDNLLINEEFIYNTYNIYNIYRSIYKYKLHVYI